MYKDLVDSETLFSNLAKIGISLHDFTKPLYKYTSIDTAKKILSNFRIRFRTPSSFNDPFEFNMDLLHTTKNNKELRLIFENKIKRNPYFKSKQKKEARKHTIFDFIDIYNNNLQEQRKQSLVFCTSELNDNILMWSHYASSHKGVCIGLFIPPYDPGLECFTLKVNYSKKVQPLDYITEDLNEMFFALSQWAFTKAVCWDYESEVRTFIPNIGNALNIDTEKKFLDVSVQKEYIKEIYFGMESSENDIQEIQQMLKNNQINVPTKKMIKKKNEFTLEPIDI